MLTLFISPAIFLSHIAVRAPVQIIMICHVTCGSGKSGSRSGSATLVMFFRNWGEDERIKTESLTGSQNNCSGSSPASRPASCPQTGESGRRKGKTPRGKERSDVSGNQQVLTGGQQNNSWSQESLQVSVEDPDPGLFLNLGAAQKFKKLKK
jgi:hypothetical protein